MGFDLCVRVHEQSPSGRARASELPNLFCRNHTLVYGTCEQRAAEAMPCAVLADVLLAGRVGSQFRKSIVELLTARVLFLPSYTQKRHRADKEVNDRLVRVLREGTFQTVTWEEV